VTAADLQRVASTYLRTDNRIVMHTLPGAGAPQPSTPTQTR
jgi:hypothetical protein